MKQDLGSFHHRVARQITGRQPRRTREGGWEYPPLTAAMEESGFKEIGVYIKRMQNTVVQYIATRPILDLCEKSVRKPGDWVYWRWWDQEGINLEGERERVEMTSDGKEKKCVEEVAQEETTIRI